MRAALCIPIATVLLAAQADRQAEALLQSGIHAEVVKGDLESAIQQYKKLLARYSSVRETAARALLRLGYCYERLGNAEAQRAYSRVLREYGDLKETADEARARLAALGQPAAATTTRQVWTGPNVDVFGSLSPDGRYLSCVDWTSGDLAVRDLATGQLRRLTNKGSWDVPGFALTTRISPDGKLVAYDWWNEKGVWEIRVGGLDGFGHRTIRRNDEMEDQIESWVAGWSPDGRHVLAALVSPDGNHQIALIPLDGGAARVLKSTGRRAGIWRMAFSPDGKYIAYELSPNDRSSERDINLLAADGSQDTRIIEHPADDYGPVWTPDGRRLLFASDRTGTRDLWMVSVAGGKSQGSPELVKRNLDMVYPLGLTAKGSLYYGISTGMMDVYTASLDMHTGQVTGAPARAAQRFIGSNRHSAWSPDGRSLAFVSGRGPFATAPGPRVLCILSLETGKLRELPLRFNLASFPRWLPDGRSILLKGTDPKEGTGLYRVDLQSGDARQLIARGHLYALRDGKTIVFTRVDDAIPKDGIRVGRILTRDIDGGPETEIYREATTVQTGDALVNDLALSPDGQNLAFTVLNGKEPKSIKVIPAFGGEARVVYRITPGDPQGIPNFSGVEWTRDGKELLFVRSATREVNTGSPVERDLWSLPVAGGAPRKLGLSMAGLADAHLHPDGKRISFTAGRNQFEIWVLENFLR